MKLRNLTKSVLVALMVASPLVGAEVQYPAADFQPEIIKQDAELIKQHEAAKAAAPQTTTAVQAAKAESAPAVAPATKPEPAVKSEVSAAAPKAEESSNLPLILILAGVGAAAFWFMRKPKTAAGVAAPASTPAATGVARYISSLPETVGSSATTGVARYIDSLPPAAPVTGVAKYIKTLPATESPYSAPPKAPTGVEKYLKTLPEPAKVLGETGVAKYLKTQGLAA